VFIHIPKGGYKPTFEPRSEPVEEPALESGPRCRLAVLPFEVISVEKEGWKLGRAICISLTASLTDLDGVQAIAHGYAQEWTLLEASRELRASHVIHGSVLEFDHQYRVVVNLIHLAEGTQLWAREYDLNKGDTSRVHSEVVATISNEVAARLGTRRPHAFRLAAAA
jgi:TolB-like protein